MDDGRKTQWKQPHGRFRTGLLLRTELLHKTAWNEQNKTAAESFHEPEVLLQIKHLIQPLNTEQSLQLKAAENLQTSEGRRVVS